jgi:hypothetical protein
VMDELGFGSASSDSGLRRSERIEDYQIIVLSMCSDVVVISQ